ncbi:MAG: exosortase A [Gammaproteobacteria bacterium]
MPGAAASAVSDGGRDAWVRRLAWLGVALLATVLVRAETYANLYTTWWGTTAYNHGALIPFIALWLAWQSRARLQALPTSISLLGLAFVAVNALVWLAGRLLLINVLQHVAAVGFLIGMTWMLIGNRAARLLLFPLAYLYFMVPEGIGLVPYLQDWTATVLVTLLRMTEIPVYIEGRYLQIPSGSFHVAKACSGINYLLATLAVGSMFAYLTYRSNWRRLAFMGLAVAVPLVANGMRAYGIVMIAHLSDYRYAMGVDHYIYGWVFFGIVIFILFAIGRTFSDIDDETEEPAAMPSGADLDAGGQPAAGPGAPWPWLAAAMIVLAAPQWAITLGERAVPAHDAFALPELAGWTGPAADAADLGSHYRGAHRVLDGAYTATDGTAVDVEVAVWLAQRQGEEFVHYENTVYDEDDWRLLSAEAIVATGATSPAEVHTALLRGDGQRQRLLWWWYQVGARATPRALVAKFIEGTQRFSGGYGGAAIVAVSTALTEESPEVGARRLAAFVAALESAGLGTATSGAP